MVTRNSKAAPRGECKEGSSAAEEVFSSRLGQKSKAYMRWFVSAFRKAEAQLATAHTNRHVEHLLDWALGDHKEKILQIIQRTLSRTEAKLCALRSIHLIVVGQQRRIKARLRRLRAAAGVARLADIPLVNIKAHLERIQRAAGLHHWAYVPMKFFPRPAG